MKKTLSTFLNEGASKAGKRILTRSLQRKLTKDWQIGGAMSLVAIADEAKAGVKDAVKALASIDGMGEFKKAKLAGGMKASYEGGIVSVITSDGKVRVEYA